MQGQPQAEPAPAVQATPAPTPASPAAAQAIDPARAELAALLARAEEAYRRRHFRAASEEATRLLARLSSNGSLRPALEPRANDLLDVARLFADMLVALPRMADRTWPIAKDLTGMIEGATDGRLELKVGAARSGVAWADVPADRMLDLFRRAGSQDPYALAVFCFDNGLAADGSRELNRFVTRTPGGDGRAQGLVARVRGTAAPSDGFVFHEDRWLTREERRYAVLQSGIESLAERIRKGKHEEAVAAAMGFNDVLAQPDVRPDFAEGAKALRVAALQARRTALLDQLRKQPAMASIERVKALKRELNAARAEAMRVIFDTNIYPDEDHGRPGQPTVDQKVRKVRELWERPAESVAGSDRACREVLGSIRELDGLLTQYGAGGGRDEELDRALSALNRQVGLRTVALDDKEQGVIDANRRIWEYNGKVPSGMTPEERRVVTLVNEYREMMGLRILEFDDALAKAARGHSNDMEDRGFFAHDNPDGKDPGARCWGAGYPSSGVGENIAMGMSLPEEAHLGWYNSSGHHRNMLQGMWTQMGCGHSGVHWTENFGAAAGESR